MMILLAMLLAQALGGCLNPDDSTASGRRALAAGERCLEARPDASFGARLRAPHAIPPATKAAIKSYFDGILFDQPSARWRWPQQRGNSAFYCGWVNAKNRMGAYVGWQPFYVRLDSPTNVVSGTIVEDQDGVVYRTICGGEGYEMTVSGSVS